MADFKRELKKYDYSFPKSLIAQKPALPRDSAKFLVYDRKSGKIRHDVFCNLPKYLPVGALLVLNRTKVIPARLALTKDTGGKVRILYLATEGGLIKVLSDRGVKTGSRLVLNSKISFEVSRRDGKFYFLRPSFPAAETLNVLLRFGTAPIPPYVKHTPLGREELKSMYQSVFAKVNGSVAAPTASLHFTKRLLKALKRKGIVVRFITLHAGLGTFAPLTRENLENNMLHSECYEIPRRTVVAVNLAKTAGNPVIAVGTTVVRALESSARDGGLNPKKLARGTDLFIRDGYKFKIVDGLITNFHVPKSSLLMLVSAFAGRKKLLGIYKAAISCRYKLFSFGDAMLII